MLTVLIFFPLFGALTLCAARRENESFIKTACLLIAGIEFFASLWLYFSFNSAQGYQFAHQTKWIPAIGASYHVALDGISLFLFLLTTFLTFLAVIYSQGSVHEKIKEYYICLLLLETALLGVFTSLDLLLFYMFWEAVLIPMVFLIGIWGHEKRIYASIKFLLYTMSGSVFLLIGILILYFLHASQTVSHEYTFNILKLSETSVRLPLETQKVLFFLFAIAFAIKVPMFPFHTWLPDAHVEAPTAGSVLLAGVLLKMGTYGFLRFCLPMFPEACIAYAPFISKLALCGIIYGALVSWVQTDFKKLVAYSSVSHLGFVMLGLFAFTQPSVSGSYLQMINHGISTGALFFIVGMLYDRRHTRKLSDFGGLSKVMPFFSVCFLITSLSSIGLPGLNGFVGEFLILSGTFLTNWTFAFFASFGVILSAVYMLNAFQKIMHGEIHHEENKTLPDLSLREKTVLVPLLILMVLLGVMPSLLLRKTELPIANALKPVERILTHKPEVTWNHR